MTNPWETSGLEFLRRIVAGEIPRAAITQTVPMRFLEVAHGHMKIIARADSRHINPLGGVHGGFAATVMDSVASCAVHAGLEAGVGYTTLELQVKMLRPVPVEEDLIAEGRMIHRSRNIATSEGTLKSAEGKLLATATATCFLKHL